jgi:phosphoribosylaminoimidazolecarboxamide formyltransferase/IMP cyclohydrolase
MLRAAAKNHADVAVVVNPSDYAPILTELQTNVQQLSGATRFNLAVQCFAHTASYDTQIAAYLSGLGGVQFPETLNLQFEHHQALRYGENPHQNAAFYREKAPASGTTSPMPTRP